ncbi:MAG: methyltransferase domain-containing protein, partial [Vicinamibacterales bacterium]
MGGFDAQFVPQLLAVEDRHFWFRARNAAIATLARQATIGLDPGYLVLDVGCGTGNTLKTLQSACRSGRALGLDSLLDGLPHARSRSGRPVVQADILQLPFGAAPRFHLIGLFDVLEHIQDDSLALARLRELLVPGGALLVTVPAHPKLWSYFDEAARHCRRYSIDSLSARLTESGYRAEYVTPFMSSLYPVLWVTRKLGGLSRRGCTATLPDLRVVPIVNSLLFRLLSRDARLIGARRKVR